MVVGEVPVVGVVMLGGEVVLGVFRDSCVDETPRRFVPLSLLLQTLLQ